MKKTLKKQFIGKHLTKVEEFIRVYSKWMIVDETDSFYIVFGAIFANIHLQSLPVWMYIISVPGGGKTSLLQALKGHRFIHFSSSLTEKTLVSGLVTNGQEPSLLPKLNNKVWVLKDLTNLLSDRREIIAHIFGQLREMYDGEGGREYGTGESRHYESKFGIIAAVTNEIDHHITLLSPLGERFLFYRMPELNDEQRRERALRASQNINMKQQEAEIKATAHKVLDFIPLVPDLPEAILDQIETIAAFVAKARAKVHRDRYTREITSESSPEVHTRLNKQLSDLARGIAMAKEKNVVSTEELRLIRKVGIDCIPPNRVKFLRFLAEEYPSPVSNVEVGDACGISRSSAFYKLDDLYQLNLIDKIKTSTNLSVYEWQRYKWVLKEEYVNLLK